MEPSDNQLDQLQKEFEDTLVFPLNHSKDRKQFVLCPIGLIGSGKTTVMRPLCEQLGVLRISGDEIRKFFKDKGFGWDRVAELGLRIGKKYAKEGYDIGVDSDCVREDKRTEIEGVAKEVNAMVFYIHINPPEKFILDKLRNFKHTWLFRDGEHAIQNYEARRPLHEKLNFDFVYTFDTSKTDLDKQILESVAIIEKLVGSNADQ